MLDRRQSLLLFLAAPGGSYPVDQIRIMKGLFLWSQEAPEAVRQLYRFEPYDFGPFDTTVYRDLDSLEAEGMLRVEGVGGTSQKRYSLTTQGVEAASEALVDVPIEVSDRIKGIKQHVTSLGFVALLRDIYAQHPDYAAKSIARL